MLTLAFSAPADGDGDGLVDRKGGTGVVVRVKTDRGEDFRDRFGRLLAYLDARSDLPAVSGGKPYDLGEMQVTLGNSPAYRYEGSRFARYGSYRTSEQKARSSRSGVWGSCSGDSHSEQ